MRRRKSNIIGFIQKIDNAEIVGGEMIKCYDQILNTIKAIEMIIFYDLSMSFTKLLLEFFNKLMGK